MVIWSVCSEMQIVCIWSSWCHCHPKTPSSPASFKSTLVLPFWYWITQAVLEKRPLNGCSSISSYTRVIKQNNTHPFNGPFSGTTQVSRYQKGKTNLDFTEARDSEWQWHQLDHMQTICISLQTDQITTLTPHHLIFYRPDALADAQSSVSKHWRLL